MTENGISRLADAWRQAQAKLPPDFLKELKPSFATLSSIPVERLYSRDAPEGPATWTTSGLSRRVPVHARRPADDVPRPLLDDAPVRRLRARAEESNERYKYLLEQGQTGLSVAFDLPTQIGYDSDDPMALGEVGKVGVAIDSLEDMETLFDGIPLDKVTTSMTINAPAAILLAMYIAVAEKQGVDRRAAARHGPERHPQGVHRARHLHLPARARRMRLDHRHLRLLRRSTCRNWNTISISGYHIREAGSTAVQEVAFTLADGIAYVQAALERRAGRRRLRAAACRSSSTRTTTSSRRSPSSAPRGACGRRIMKERFGAQEPALADAALPHADRRLHAHRAAAGEQRRARDAAGAGGGAGRHAVACTPTRSTRRWRCRPRRPSRSRCARSRSSPTRPAWPTRSTRWPARYYVEALTDEIERKA